MTGRRLSPEDWFGLDLHADRMAAEEADRIGQSVATHLATLLAAVRK